ncbi:MULTISPECIES: sulfatase [unclassified Lentimonas]|uniref:sulfatase family protein n=1 Tax=unclassified Lentimonas TaxID=2630993 RepID=UPI001321AA65|nr:MULTISPECIES: sulfatase [unclassified Lentimonas]CAA6692719.1 Choline-sulfatase (EC [Lentimonas sp. CC10]CAA6696715.1 Choline-sulfatase (EC [Lentimonas sp. CC19]CAA7072305.1 Choline-sulfatase (EC [Lentimonas sp. CC11]
MKRPLPFIITLLSAWICATQVYAADSRPNILFVMSDDHTAQAIGAYGGRLAVLNPTPTIDTLAAEGMLMENAFTQNAICTPSRAIIMTGQSSAVNGCPRLGSPLPPERQYLAIEMGKAGYDTAVIGKWHLKARPEAFNYYKVLPGQGLYFDPIFFEKGLTGEKTYQERNKQVTYTGAMQMKGHSSYCIADSTLDWFKNKRDPNKPFFLKLHFKAPHDLFQYAPRYESYLADVTIPEPDNMRDRSNHGSIATRGHNDELVPYIGTSIGRRHYARNYTNSGGWVKELDQSMSDEEIHGAAYQGYLKAYLRCVKGVDDNLKRVIDYLKAEGLYENTIIMYTGDQGFYLGEHDYMDKRWPYEESMRMPFIVRYPKSVNVGRSEAIVENIDYAPTMLDFAGVETPEYMHGKSFRSILETGEAPADWKTSAYYHYWQHLHAHDNPACIAIRTERHKLILFYGTSMYGDEPNTPPAWELYDLKLDPTEDNNVMDNPEYAGVVEQLKQELKERRAELSEDNPEIPFNKVIDQFWDYGAEELARAIDLSHSFRAAKERGEMPTNGKAIKAKKK